MLLVLDYKGIETRITLQGDLYIDHDLVLDTKGTIRYGFLKLNYEKLLKDARSLVQDTKIATKREKAYSMLINLIEDYNVKLLSTKVYWNSPKEREEYKKFWNKYKEISKIKENDFIEYIKQKEILFIKDDMKKLDNDKTDYSKIMKYYKRKLVDYDAIRTIKNQCKSEGKYIKVKEVA